MGGHTLYNVLITVPIFFAIYGFYFLWQFLGVQRGPKELQVGLEKKISYNPHWVWVYSGIYYPIIFLPCFLTDIEGMKIVWLSGAILIALQGPFFIFYPIKTPASWRKTTYDSFSEWLLVRVVQKIDKSNNCFPSMHVSVATLLSLHLFSFLGIDYLVPIFIFPILISWSCLKTKQHYIIDIIPAPLLGWVAYELSRSIL